MNLKSPLNFKDIDFKNIIFTHITKNNNKNIVYIKYQKSKNKLQNLVIQTPSLWSVNQPKKISEDFYDLEVPLVSKTKDKITDFLKFINGLDATIIHQARTFSSSWFNSENNSAKYLNTIRPDDKYNNGNLKIKIINTPDFKTILKKNNKEKIKINEIPSKSWFKSILQIYAIWVKPNNEFGLYFRPIIISFKIPENLFIYDFIESDDDNIPDTEGNNSETKNNSLFIKREDLEKNLIEESNDLQITSVLNLSNSPFSSSTSSDKNIYNNINV